MEALSQGGVLEEWDVRHYPTIYILDVQGVIRYKELHGEELEKAVNSLLKEAARKKRLSLGLRLMALLPESKGRQGSRPWGAVCLLEKF